METATRANSYSSYMVKHHRRLSVEIGPITPPSRPGRAASDATISSTSSTEPSAGISSSINASADSTGSTCYFSIPVQPRIDLVHKPNPYVTQSHTHGDIEVLSNGRRHPAVSTPAPFARRSLDIAASERSLAFDNARPRAYSAMTSSFASLSPNYSKKTAKKMMPSEEVRLEMRMFRD